MPPCPCGEVVSFWKETYGDLPSGVGPRDALTRPRTRGYDARMDMHLVRHAIAFDRDAGRWPDDRDRPLTPAGIERFQRVAKAVVRIVPTVESHLASPLVRAWQTAEILSEAGWPKPQRCEELAAGCEAEAVLAILKKARGAESLALVGHEPNLHELLGLLLAGESDRELVEFKKGGLACVRFAGAPRAGAGRLRWLLPPRVLLGESRSAEAET